VMCAGISNYPHRVHTRARLSSTWIRMRREDIGVDESGRRVAVGRRTARRPPLDAWHAGTNAHLLRVCAR
jgi:hypothetical protein